MAKMESDFIGVFVELLSTFSTYHQFFPPIINFFHLSSNKNNPFDTIFSTYYQLKKNIDTNHLNLYN